MSGLCRVATAIALGMIVACAARADDAVKFLYQPGRVPVGHAYHYLKTSLDGTHPQSLWVYVAAEDRIESWRAGIDGQPTTHVTAWMDWLTCGTRAIEVEEVRANRAPARRLAVVVGPDDRSFLATHDGPPVETERVDLAWRPWHLYDFDLVTLMMTLPHHVAARDTFQIDLAADADSSERFRDRGLMRLAYHRDQVEDGERCLVYDADGDGLAHRGGTVTVRDSDGFVQELALGLPNDAVHSGFRLTLEKATHMTQASWNRLVRRVR